MKRNLLVKMSMVLFATIVLSLCAATPPGFAEKKAKLIELSFANPFPSTIPVAKTYQQWGDRIAEKSGGRIQINFTGLNPC